MNIQVRKEHEYGRDKIACQIWKHPPKPVMLAPRGDQGTPAARVYKSLRDVAAGLGQRLRAQLWVPVCPALAPSGAHLLGLSAAAAAASAFSQQLSDGIAK